MSQIAVRAETVNVTAHCAGCNTLIIILLGLQRHRNSYKELLWCYNNYITNFFTRLLAYFGDLTEGLFLCKFYLAKCARAYETWKQCQWITRAHICKHKIWGENWLYLRPYLKAFSVFNVLKTCRVYSWLPIIRTFKGNRKKFELSGVRVIGSSSYWG